MHSPNSRRIGLALVLAVVSATAIRAGSHTWSGTASGMWSDAANWSAGGPPVSGETNVMLSFPANEGHMGAMLNDVTNLTLTSMTFSDTAYAVSGNVVHLNGTISLGAGAVSGTVTLALPIALTGTSTFASLGGRTLRVSAPISGTSGLAIQSNGGTDARVMFETANTYSGPTSVQGGTLRITDKQGLGSAAAGTMVASGATLSLPNDTVLGEGLSLAGTGDGAIGALYCEINPSCTWAGPITLTGDSLLMGRQPLAISGPIAGAFSPTFAGVTLTTNNTYTGTTRVTGGCLAVNGSQPASPVVLSHGILSGVGTAGPVSLDPSVDSLSTVRPGVCFQGPGTLVVAGLNLNHAQHPGKLDIQLAGSSPDQYERVVVNGPVDVSEATLYLTRIFDPSLGASFLIVDNDGSDPVVGTFSGLPEGTVFANYPNRTFQITYQGGTGNDIVLTVTSLTAVELLGFDVE